MSLVFLSTAVPNGTVFGFSEWADSAAHDLKGDALHALWRSEECCWPEPHDTRVSRRLEQQRARVTIRICQRKRRQGASTRTARARQRGPFHAQTIYRFACDPRIPRPLDAFAVQTSHQCAPSGRTREKSRVPTAASLLARATAALAVKLLIKLSSVVRVDLIGCQSMNSTGDTGQDRAQGELMSYASAFHPPLLVLRSLLARSPRIWARRDHCLKASSRIREGDNAA